MRMARPPIQIPSNPKTMGSGSLPESSIWVSLSARLAGDGRVRNILRRALENQVIRLEGAVPVGPDRLSVAGGVKGRRLRLVIDHGDGVAFVVLETELKELPAEVCLDGAADHLAIDLARLPRRG